MATIKAVNVTKYDAGGSGDNIISDGYIKSVENIWLDSYVVAAAMPTGTGLLIARIPKNKKITDIVVSLPVLGAAGTYSTVYCCTGATTTAGGLLGSLQPGGGAQRTTVNVSTISTVRLGSTYIGTATPADVGIYIDIHPATTVTGGTIKTLVRYT